jgi:hypothetical protein
LFKQGAHLVIGLLGQHRAAGGTRVHRQGLAHWHSHLQRVLADVVDDAQHLVA